MAKFGASLLAGVAMFGLGGAAMAADLLPPPPVDLPPPPMVSGGDYSGWYLRGDVGVGMNAAPTGLAISPNVLASGVGGGFLSASATDTFNNSSLSESSLFDVGVGYQYNNWLRGDVTLELRGGGHFQSLEVVNDPARPLGGAQQFADFYRANVRTYLGMANVYADLGSWNGVTPYVGGGLGVAYNQIYGFTDTGSNYINGVNSSSGGYFSPGSKTSFAWALMAGLDFKVTQSLTMELGYRYLSYGGFKTGATNCLTGGGAAAFGNANCSGGVANYLTSGRMASNDFRIGFRYLIGDAGPAAPTGPIIRKY